MYCLDYAERPHQKAGMTSSKFFMFLRDFVQEYHPAKLGLQINEKHGRGDFLFFALYFTRIAQPEQG